MSRLRRIPETLPEPAKAQLHVHAIDEQAQGPYLFGKCGARVTTVPERGARIKCEACLAILRLEDQHQQDVTGPRR